MGSPLPPQPGCSHASCLQLYFAIKDGGEPSTSTETNPREDPARWPCLGQHSRSQHTPRALWNSTRHPGHWCLAWHPAGSSGCSHPFMQADVLVGRSRVSSTNDKHLCNRFSPPGAVCGQGKQGHAAECCLQCLNAGVFSAVRPWAPAPSARQGSNVQECWLLGLVWRCPGSCSPACFGGTQPGGFAPTSIWLQLSCDKMLPWLCVTCTQGNCSPPPRQGLWHPTAQGTAQGTPHLGIEFLP